MLDQILTFVMYFAIGYVLCEVIYRVISVIMLVRQSKQVLEEVEREIVEKHIHIIKQEKDGDMLYWFDQDSDQFIAQGRSHMEIIAVLRERFPKHIFVLNENEMLVGPQFDRIHNFNKA